MGVRDFLNKVFGGKNQKWDPPGTFQNKPTTTVETPTTVRSTTHTVVKGESLSTIALKHYGNGNDYMRIYTANQPLLKDPDKIYPGQVLTIPAK